WHAPEARCRSGSEPAWSSWCLLRAAHQLPTPLPVPVARASGNVVRILLPVLAGASAARPIEHASAARTLLAGALTRTPGSSKSGARPFCALTKCEVRPFLLAHRCVLWYKKELRSASHPREVVASSKKGLKNYASRWLLAHTNIRI